MRLYRHLTLALVGVIALAAPVRAEGFLAPFAGFTFGGDVASTCRSLTNCQEKRLAWGAAFGSTHGIFGFEEDIAYAPDFFGKTAGGDNAVLTAMTNFMLIVPAGPVRPFAVAGLGLIRPHAKFDAQSLTVDQNAFGYELGGGVDLFLLGNVGIRGDVRHVQTFDTLTLGVFSNQKLDFWRGGAGLVLRF